MLNQIGAAALAGLLSYASVASGAERLIRVRADREWTETGIDVRTGERLEFSASGTIVWGRNGEEAGPEGGYGGGYFRPYDDAGVGALIGRIGGSPIFFVGERAVVPAPESGDLLLGINDDKFGDNRGEFRVRVRTQGYGGGWGGSPSGGPGTTATPGEEYFWWKGRVDGSDYLIVQGKSVRVRHLDKLPIQNQDFRFSSPLPATEVPLALNTIRARGMVRLAQEPDRSNDFTAMILIDDSDQKGSYEYELELTWERPRRGRFEERAFSGVFRWKGRVDIAVTIEIQGRSSHYQDEGGRPTVQEVAHFTAPLPQREVPLSLHKLRGRGDLTLVQQPESSNGYTAIVRIEDPKGGSDTYEFELGWY